MVAVFAGGGTGGHLYPALALADALVALRPDVRPVFVGARRGVESRVLPERGVEHLLLPVRGVDRGAGLANWRVVPALLGSLASVHALFRRERPGVVVVTGGYAGGPAGIVAVLGGVPLVVQEQNSVPGLVTRTLARFARQVHVAFPEAGDLLPASARGRVSVSGNPVQPPREVDRAAARRGFGLGVEGTVVLVVGGSQGSRALNEAVLEAVLDVAGGGLEGPPGLQLLWATGPAHVDGVREALARTGDPDWVRPVGYIDDMPSALAAADLAVSRAGAMATSEFLAWGVPAILVPLPTAAANHQEHNAAALEEGGAAVHIPERELTGARLWSAVRELAADAERLASLREAARARGRPDAARRIAEAVAEVLPAAALGGSR